jgi:hypothetical protein
MYTPYHSYYIVDMYGPHGLWVPTM